MKRFIVLCNGEPPSKELFQQKVASADFFIAADGGGNRSRELGQAPDVVIGDLDSFESKPGDDFEVVFQPDQNTNDLEKALQLAKEKQASHVQVLGATGYRLDHTLKNLSVLKQFNPHFEQLVLQDNFGKTFLAPRHFQKELPVGAQISLFPLSGKVDGITTSGLKYPLDHESLENGVRDGSSNEVVGNPVQVTYTQGDLLIFIADSSTAG